MSEAVSWSSNEPVYVRDTRRVQIVGFAILSFFALLLTYAFFLSGFYQSVVTESQYIIGVPILLLIALDVYVGYRIPKALRLEFYFDHLKAGRGAKAKEYPYSDLKIDRIGVQSSNAGVYSVFRISSKGGDSKAKWILRNVKLKKLDTALLRWLEDRVETDHSINARTFRASGFINFLFIFVIPFVVAYIEILRILPSNIYLEIALGIVFFGSSGLLSYFVFNKFYKRTMARSAKIREIMEQEGFKPENMRELRAKVKEIKQRLKEQERTGSASE
jgi:hypothetical protein